MSTQPTTSDLASSVGGFVLGFVVGTEQKAEAQTAVTNTAISSYVQFGSDKSVIITFGGCELGRGSMTGLARCAAEDLMVDWRAVKIVTLINSTTYYGTGGQQRYALLLQRMAYCLRNRAADVDRRGRSHVVCRFESLYRGPRRGYP